MSATHQLLSFVIHHRLLDFDQLLGLGHKFLIHVVYSSHEFIQIFDGPIYVNVPDIFPDFVNVMRSYSSWSIYSHVICYVKDKLPGYK